MVIARQEITTWWTTLELLASHKSRKLNPVGYHDLISNLPIGIKSGDKVSIVDVMEINEWKNLDWLFLGVREFDIKIFYEFSEELALLHLGILDSYDYGYKGKFGTKDVRGVITKVLGYRRSHKDVYKYDEGIEEGLTELSRLRGEAVERATRSTGYISMQKDVDIATTITMCLDSLLIFSEPRFPIDIEKMLNFTCETNYTFNQDERFETFYTVYKGLIDKLRKIRLLQAK